MTNPNPYGYAKTPRSDVIIGVAASMLVLAVLAMVLRFLGMLTVKTHRFFLDDAFALAALPFVIALNSLLIWAADQGILGGRGSDGDGRIPLDVVTFLLKFNYASQILFQIGISLPKFSALCFYYRIFGRTSKKFYVALWVAGALAALWMAIAVLVTALQCNPPRRAWHPEISEGGCLDMWPMFLGLAITSMAIDVLILVLPMFPLWELNVSRSRKLTVAAIFLCGYCVVICSIGRVVTLSQELAAFRSSNPLYSTAPYFAWISTEGAVSIVGVCLPFIFKFFKRVWDHGFTSQQHSSVGDGITAYDNQYGRHRDKTKSRTRTKTVNLSANRTHIMSAERGTELEETLVDSAGNQTPNTDESVDHAMKPKADIEA